MQPAYRCPCLLNFPKELLPQVRVGARLGVCFGVRGVPTELEGRVVKIKCED